MVVSLSALKVALGVASTDSSQDSFLTAAAGRAVAWIEQQTGRRFQQPEEVTEYLPGSGTTKLYLPGHIDDADAVVLVRERAARWPEWEEFTSFERRRDVLVRHDGYPWHRSHEYEVTYEDGYATAPGDIQALVIELVRKEHSAASGSVGIKKETIGEYSYEMDSSATESAGKASDIGAATINRWRRGAI